jgi:hypothetical protein
MSRIWLWTWGQRSTALWCQTVRNHVFRDLPQVRHSQVSNHAVCLRWPISAQFPLSAVENLGRPKPLVRVLVDGVDDALLHQIQVQLPHFRETVHCVSL